MTDSDKPIEVQNLETLENSATKSVTADGLTVQYDLEFAEKRRLQLERLNPTDRRLVRPRIYSIRLGGIR